MWAARPPHLELQPAWRLLLLLCIFILLLLLLILLLLLHCLL
jgi:hypothetical protein